MSIEIKKCAVLGAGVMGGGVAYVAADKGIHVRLKDINTAAISLGLKSAYALWNKKLAIDPANEKDKKINVFL